MKNRVEKVYRHFFLKVSVICALFYGMNLVAGRVEGTVFPVIKPIQIKEISEKKAGWSEISGVLTRTRSCDFRGLRLEYENASGSTLVDYKFLEPSKVRGQGPESFGPWLVQFTEDQIGDIRATAFHRCHPAYLTETTVNFVR